MFNVLLVDDEPDIIEGLRLLVNWEEYEVENVYTAFSVEEAKKVLENKLIQILITDINMQPESGLDLLKVVNEDYPDTRCMVLSGYDNFSYVKDAMSLGIENYLLKPVDEEELVSSIIQVEQLYKKSVEEQEKRKIDEGLIQSNFLQRWVSGTAITREMKEKCESIGINFFFEAYWVCVISDASFISKENSSLFKNNSDIMEVLELCRKKFGNRAYMYIDLNNQVTMIFYSEKCNIDKEYLSSIKGIEQLLDQLKNINHIDVYAGVGDIVEDYSQVPKSFQKASHLLHVNTHAETNTLREVRQDDCEKETLENLFSIQVNDIKKYIEATDKAGANRMIDTFVNDVESSGRDSLVWQILFFQQMALSIVSCVEFSKNKDLYDQAENLLYDIHFSKDQNFHDFVFRLKYLAENTIDFLDETKNRYSPVIGGILNYIDEHYAEEISLGIIADKVNANPVYLGQLFHYETDQYFSDYLNNIRLEKAKSLLLESKNTVIEIALMVGYSSKTHFFQMFKKKFGVTPTEFRRNKKA